ncbi:VanZ family protein [Nakamurella deserti]|uniref:VanZ family protein n=1 Tax=Nakamurella deserti TaxID=2164074 RepID=UPI0013002069|nr:VanZ family protein [Nakamurella deserti]
MHVPPALVTLREERLEGRPVAHRLRLVALVLLGLTVFVSGLIVFTPGPPARHGQSWLHHWSAVWQASGAQPRFLTYDTVEWGSNLLMFLPIGFLFAAAVRPALRHWVVPVAAAGSVVIETVQLFIPERVSSVSDVLSNTVGALLGVLLLVHLTERTSGRRAAAGVVDRAADGPSWTG